jgi:regulator of sirC expression with transglutaminase-like and TPR domain
MKAIRTEPQAGIPGEGKRAALISLLADEDPGVYQTIRKTILGYGAEGVSWLQAFTAHPDPVLRRRALEIIQFWSSQQADNEMLAFCVTHGEDLDIEEGALLLARTRYSDISLEAHRALFDQYAAELADSVYAANDAETTLARMNEYLFGRQGFRGNENHYYDPENSYINRVVARKLGNPIALCLVFLVVARRLSLPIVGVGLPGHFLCRYQSPKTEFFIDAFSQGKVWTKAECIRYLTESGHGYLESYLAPITPRRMLLRMCANLHQIYIDLEAAADAALLQRYIIALSR